MNVGDKLLRGAIFDSVAPDCCVAHGIKIGKPRGGGVFAKVSLFFLFLCVCVSYFKFQNRFTTPFFFINTFI